MKERKTKALAIFLILALLMSACSSKTTEKTKKSKSTTEEGYEKHSMDTKDPDATEETSETTEPSQRDTSVRPVATPTPTPEVIPMLTAQDIQAMNNNNALIVYNDEGYVSTIVGRFFHRPVKDEDDAINAVKGLQELLGLQTGYFPFAVYGSTYQGCTYFTYQQLKDDVTVTNATLKVVLDQEGYPYVLQSSLASNLDYKITPATINEAQAEEIISNRFGSSYQVFSQYTKKTSLLYRYNATHCFQVYTTNPAGDISFDMPYVVHFVDFDGNYLISYPTGYLPNDDTFADYGNESYFKDLEPTDCTFTVDRNGEAFTFTVPISYNPIDNKYYIADPSRKIIMANFYEFEYNYNNLVFFTSDTIDGWSANDLITYYNYIQCYEFYKLFNIESTDGFGMPILILMGYCDENGNPVNNACNMGVRCGWSLFGAADCNTYGYSLDILAHEYTHGVTNFCRQGNIYSNEYGAINEAYSDIMGNMCEMYMGDTTDTTWLMGETSGNVCRSMSNPYLYQQPMYVGDPYYLAPSLQGSFYMQAIDNGGVHINNSLISHLCYVLYQQGMSLEDLIHFFLVSIEMHTPTADYDDMYAIFVAAAQLSGHAEIIPSITQYWQDTNMAGDRDKNAENTSVPGYQRINVPFGSVDLSQRCLVLIVDGNLQTLAYAIPQYDGVASVVVPTYMAPVAIVVVVHDDMYYSNQVGTYAYNTTMDGWTDVYYGGLYNLEDGDIYTCVAFS